MNAHVFAFAPTQDHKTTDPSFEPETTTLPDREWGLSARQVAGVVVAILVASEIIGTLF